MSILSRLLTGIPCLQVHELYLQPPLYNYKVVILRSPIPFPCNMIYHSEDPYPSLPLPVSTLLHINPPDRAAMALIAALSTPSFQLRGSLLPPILLPSEA